MQIAEEEYRCRCGHLLAILSLAGAEIKCKRCKSLHTISLEQIETVFKNREPVSSDSSGQPANQATVLPEPEKCRCQ